MHTVHVLCRTRKIRYVQTQDSPLVVPLVVHDIGSVNYFGALWPLSCALVLLIAPRYEQPRQKTWSRFSRRESQLFGSNHVWTRISFFFPFFFTFHSWLKFPILILTLSNKNKTKIYIFLQVFYFRVFPNVKSVNHPGGGSSGEWKCWRYWKDAIHLFLCEVSFVDSYFKFISSRHRSSNEQWYVMF